MKREVILEAAQKCVCGQREQDYGKPEDNFATIGLLWGVYLRAAHPELQECFHIDQITPKDVAIMMALLKVARIATGNKEDSFVDLAGYAACAGEVAAGRIQRAVEAPYAEPKETKPWWIPKDPIGDFLSRDHGTLEARPEYWTPRKSPEAEK